MSTITITLNKIRAHSPCVGGWAKLLKHLGKNAADDVEFPLSVVLDSNGLDDTLWCLRALPEHDKLWRLYAVWCARRVEHLLTDERSLRAIDVAEAYARGECCAEELRAARSAAYAAYDAAYAAYAAYAARAAARAAADAADAADATHAAADASDATHAAADATYAAHAAAAADATYAAHAAASYAAHAAAERAAQADKLREILDTGGI